METNTTEEVLTLIHDINSPLCALKGLLKEEKRKKDLEQIAVQKVISICKKISGHYQLNKEEIHCLLDTVEEVLDLKEMEHPKSVFTFEIDQSLRDLVFSFSKEDLQRVLSNLINNAIEAGATQVCFKVTSQRKKVLIKVIDNGTGFFAMDIAQVHSKNRHTTKNEGSGLGMSSAKNFLKSLKGELKILSTPYVGSNIILSFPRHLFDFVDFGPVVG